MRPGGRRLWGALAGCLVLTGTATALAVLMWWQMGRGVSLDGSAPAAVKTREAAAWAKLDEAGLLREAAVVSNLARREGAWERRAATVGLCSGGLLIAAFLLLYRAVQVGLTLGGVGHWARVRTLGEKLAAVLRAWEDGAARGERARVTPPPTSPASGRFR